MRRSTDRPLVSHTDNLPWPADLHPLLAAGERERVALSKRLGKFNRVSSTCTPMWPMAPRPSGAAWSAAIPTSSACTLETQFAELPAAVWGERLRQAGISAHAVVPVAETMVDPWVRSHCLSVMQTVEDVDKVTIPGLSVRLSDTPMRLGSPPYRPGSDAEAILQELGIAEAMPALAQAWVLQTSDLPSAW